ncbi:MAG TPA: hypothetical protein VLU43_05975 [Anaeromyxobacteraceae bacterium]|nr:hypothetical protein [Anaeromyxobacteraceae bacterium]
MARTRIGELLVAQGRIDPLQLQSALAHQRQFGGRLGRAIVQLGFMEELTLLEAVGEQLGVPLVEIGDRQIPPQVLALVPQKLMRARHLLPLARLSEHRRGPLVVALANPGDLGAVDEVAFATGMQVKPVLAADEDLDRALARLLDGLDLPARSETTGRMRAVQRARDDKPLQLVRAKTPLN